MPLRAKLILFVLLPMHLNLSGALSNTPSEAQIIVSTTKLYDFREVYSGMFSDVQFYEVSANGLKDNLIISSQEPFRISLHCYDDFKQTIVLKPTAGKVDTTRVFVRFFPEHTGKQSGTIHHDTEGSHTAKLEVSGAGVENLTPANYYSTATGKGDILKTQLHNIISNHTTQTYNSLWTHFTTTDATFSGKVWDIYSDIPCEAPPYIYTFVVDQDTGFGGGKEGEYYNREHSMPRAWFGGSINPMNTDLYHIYPVDKHVNAIRDNLPFGEVDNPSASTLNGGKLGNNTRPGYSATAFEPIESYKGDLARTFFYMITRYENLIEDWTYSQEGMTMLDNNRFPGYKEWALDMLIEWHELDPVSQKEINRNNSVYQIQGNRNPFVDHPEFVRKIWKESATSIAENNAHTKLYIYPNPANTHFSIEGSKEIMTIRLFSSLGKAILTKHNIYPGQKIITNDLVPGPYIVHIQTSQKTTQMLVIIQ